MPAQDRRAGGGLLLDHDAVLRLVGRLAEEDEYLEAG